MAYSRKTFGTRLRKRAPLSGIRVQEATGGMKRMDMGEGMRLPPVLKDTAAFGLRTCKIGKLLKHLDTIPLQHLTVKSENRPLDTLGALKMLRKRKKIIKRSTPVTSKPKNTAKLAIEARLPRRVLIL